MEDQLEDRTEPPPGWRVYEGSTDPLGPGAGVWHWENPNGPGTCRSFPPGCQASREAAIARCWESLDYYKRLAQPKPIYAPEYEPENWAKFDEMSKDAQNITTPDALRTYTMCWLLDPSYPRQDIYVVLRRVEKAKGWAV
jgi:hypothetical protein